MAEDVSRSRLGRGLASLIGDINAEPAPERGRNQRRVPIENIKANPRNPRRHFSEVELEELASSIRERGVIQPIVVRSVRGAIDAFEIIAGERRWRAAQRANVHDIPVVVAEVSDSEALQLAIIENVQRADLNPLEEAAGYQSLADEFHYSHDDIAKFVGKSRSHVANAVRLLKLPESVKALINGGKLSAGHARVLIGNANADKIAQDVVSRGLNVRQVEDLARADTAHPRKTKGTSKPGKDANTIALEKRVSDALGLKVSVDHGDNGGTVHIAYRDLDQLDEILKRLSRS